MDFKRAFAYGKSKKKKKKGKVFQEKNKMIHRRLGSRREGLLPLSPVDRVARGSLSTHGEGSVHASHRPTGSPASLTEQLQPTSLKEERETHYLKKPAPSAA